MYISSTPRLWVYDSNADSGDRSVHGQQPKNGLTALLAGKACPACNPHQMGFRRVGWLLSSAAVSKQKVGSSLISD